MTLDDMLQHKQQEVASAIARMPLEELARRARPRAVPHRFRDALTSAAHRPALIAELKRKSPSAGMLRERFDPVRLGQELEDAGAAALSVLTDERYFGGSLDILRDVRSFVEIPVLRKDFILDPYQVYEAAVAGADAVLLIARILKPHQLESLRSLAESLGMDALIEIHADVEAPRAITSGGTLVGINHRDLDTLSMDHGLTERLIPQLPDGTTIVAESGLRNPEDIARMQRLGAHAVLIGEALMAAPDPVAKVRELFTGVW